MNDETPATPGAPAGLSEVLERRRADLLAFIERRLGPALRGKVEPQDIAQEAAIRALRAEPPADADHFGWLCHVAEQTTADVSAALGVSEATVRVHLFRAIRRLRKLLAPSSTREVA